MNNVKTLSSRTAILLVGALEFIYILDFMTAMPLGPDLAAALHFAPDRIGWLTASYTLAAMLAGLLTLPFLDRFDRRSALLLSLAGLGLATLASAQASGLWSLLIARAFTGLCGAPALATGMAIVIDATPPQARGGAIAKVMIGFSAAVIAGVPLALELARFGNWQTPFLFLALLSLVLWLIAHFVLPPLRGHLGNPRRTSARALLARPAIRLACALQANSQFAAFLVIPSFAAFFVLNLAYPREQLGMLYLIGGLCAFAAVQIGGRLTDQYGAKPTTLVATLAFVLGLLPMLGLHILPVTLAFVLFMAGNAARNISLMATITQLPEPHERAGFMALQNMVQDGAITIAAWLASLVLSTSAGRLQNTEVLAVISAAAAVSVVLVLYRLLKAPEFVDETGI